MAWTIPRSWIPGEFVTASMLNTHLRDNLTFLFGASKVDTYSPTLAPVQNTVTETDVLHFTVPANAWSDGEQIKVAVGCLIKNNSGTNRRPIFKVNVGAGAQVQLRYAGGGGSDLNLLAGNSATEYKVVLQLFLRRVGADVWVTNQEYPYITDTGGLTVAVNTPDLLQTQVDGISTPANFTGSNVVTLKITLDAADATFYVKPQAGQVLHFKG